jgi:hypothetical protein
MKPTHLLGIDFGASSLRIQWSTLNPNGQDYLPPTGADFAEARDGVMPQLLELDAARRRIVCYGRKAEYRLREEGGSPRMLSNLKAALEGGAEAVSGRDEAFRWCEALLQEVAVSLAKRYNSPLTPEYGWAIYAGAPDRWSHETHAAYKQMLERCFVGGQISLVMEATAALHYHLHHKALPPVAAGSRVLIVNCGDGGTDFVAGALNSGSDTLENIRSYRDDFGNRRFDERIARYIAAASNIALSGPPPADLLQNSKCFKEQFSKEMAQGLDSSEMRGPLLVDGKLHPCPDIVLTRSRFESDEVAGRAIREFSRALNRALNALGLQAETVDAVLPVGGGANWYFLPDLLERRFPGRRAKDTPAPHLAVAQGLTFTHALPQSGIPAGEVATPTGYRIRIQGKVYSLPVGAQLSRAEIPSLEPAGDDGVVGEVRPNRTDPAMVGLKNLSRVSWTLILPNGTRRGVDPGKSAKLTSGSTIDFNGVQGEVRG